MKRDGIVTGCFDPSIWQYEPVWYPETSQCAHTVFPIKDQEPVVKGESIPIPAWKRFVSNNSYKFSPEMVNEAATKAGIKPLMCLRNGPVALFVGTV
jgi:hypothetical protein